MAEFQDYVTVQKSVRAMKWDGENESYEALNTEIPNTFTYTRPKGTLTYQEATNKKTITVTNGQWIVADQLNKTFIIKNDVDFTASYELEAAGTGTASATAQTFG